MGQVPDNVYPHYAQINFTIDVFPLMNDGSLDTSKKLTRADLESLGITTQAVFGVNGFNKEDCISNLKKVLEGLSYDE